MCIYSDCALKGNIRELRLYTLFCWRGSRVSPSRTNPQYIAREREKELRLSSSFTHTYTHTQPLSRHPHRPLPLSPRPNHFCPDKISLARAKASIRGRESNSRGIWQTFARASIYYRLNCAAEILFGLNCPYIHFALLASRSCDIRSRL